MRKNFSYTYLLPLLSEQVNLEKKILSKIENTYLITNKNDKLGYFYLLCKFDYSDSEFTDLESKLTYNDLFVDSFEVKGKILYQFKFPKEYLFEQKKFVKGRYSEFKLDGKKLILRFWTETYGHIPSFVSNSLLKIKQVLFKDEKLREKMNLTMGVDIEKGSELASIIDKEEETFYFDEEKKLVDLKDLNRIF